MQVLSAIFSFFIVLYEKFANIFAVFFFHLQYYDGPPVIMPLQVDLPQLTAQGPAPPGWPVPPPGRPETAAR